MYDEVKRKMTFKSENWFKSLWCLVLDKLSFFVSSGRFVNFDFNENLIDWLKSSQQITLQLIVLFWAICFIFFGIPLIYCICSVPVVVLLMASKVYYFEFYLMIYDWIIEVILFQFVFTSPIIIKLLRWLIWIHQFVGSLKFMNHILTYRTKWIQSI